MFSGATVNDYDLYVKHVPKNEAHKFVRILKVDKSYRIQHELHI